MRLVWAQGNVRMQQALSHTYVRSIVDILLQHREVLEIVSEVLQRFQYPQEPGLATKLASIRVTYSQTDVDGNTIIPTHIVNLLETLDGLYQQNKERIQYQRGAVVELLGRKLVCSRYITNQECSNGGHFRDDQGRHITEQEVDVAALSQERQHAEGYECKLKARELESHDCIDLAYLLDAAQGSGYSVNIGVISFDSDKMVNRRLRHLQPTFQHLPSASNIRVYGLESIWSLQDSPFQ